MIHGGEVHQVRGGNRDTPGVHQDVHQHHWSAQDWTGFFDVAKGE